MFDNIYIYIYIHTYIHTHKGCIFVGVIFERCVLDIKTIKKRSYVHGSESQQYLCYWTKKMYSMSEQTDVHYTYSHGDDSATRACTEYRMIP